MVTQLSSDRQGTVHLPLDGHMCDSRQPRPCPWPPSCVCPGCRGLRPPGVRPARSTTLTSLVETAGGLAGVSVVPRWPLAEKLIQLIV